MFFQILVTMDKKNKAFQYNKGFILQNKSQFQYALTSKLFLLEYCFPALF